MRLLIVIMLVWLAGCSPSDVPLPTQKQPLQLSCQSINQGVCLDIADGEMVIQTDQQTTLSVWDSSVTFSSTIYVKSSGTEQFTVAALDGTVVVSKGGISRIINPGVQVTNATNNPEPYELSELAYVALSQLPRAINLPQPIPTTSDQERIEATDSCPRPDNWLITYTIQRGDTLSRIANVNNTTIAEIQEYNCIANINRITPGDMLFVPGEVTPEITPESLFYADNDIITSGDCTTLRWSAEDARIVYLQTDAVARTANREVCPETTANYTLVIVNPDGVQLNYTVTIQVE